MHFDNSDIFKSRGVFGSLLLTAIVIGVMGGPFATADDADKIDGALWRFGMTPIKKGPEPMRGIFRVKGKELFQKTKPRSKEYDRLIGEKVGFKKKTTSLRIDDMLAREKESGKVHTGIKGKLTLTFDELGEWSGRFVDSEGRQWEFKCERFQE